MRPIDADALLEKLKNLEASGGSNAYRKALNDALHYFFPKIIGELPTITPPPNDPLTLSELREMDGEPVWCVDGRGSQCWCLVNCDDGLPCCYDNETGLWEDCFYGMTGNGEFGLNQYGWRAYRRKPEEV